MYDIIIIGAGVTGCAVARYLSRYEGKMLVLEKAEDVCSGTSKANSAIVHAGFDAARDEGKAVLLVSLEMDEVLDVSDRILVMYEGEIVGELDPKTTTAEEIGLYMAGAKREVR